MLNSILWSDYITVVIFSSMLWYLFVIGRLYQNEWQSLLSGKSKLKGFKLAKFKGNFAFFKKKSPLSIKVVDAEIIERDTLKQDTIELYPKLLEAIQESARLGRSKEVFMNYLSLILLEYPHLQNSHFKHIINKFLVSHLSNTPQLLLTLAEVDGLWVEAN
ncbi:hypothetical protein [Flavobacterium sp. TAB 87]|uniref:hypothetical protein n=1 Tax=Flavobacterium sp. TAB 87 TaxID=1729581 RepID=UPI00076C9732|nr:hypothetical protein [Flavobacterium sp. TAB 87]KVV16211.1 hypothetical protein AP058_00269 [Flavobacterium sp. TAB 87]